MSKKTITLINHQPVILEGLIGIFKKSDLFSLIDNNIFNLNDNTNDERKDPDIIIIDAGNADHLVSEIFIVKKKFIKTKIIVFTSMMDVETVVRALDAGATGYIALDLTVAELLSATKMVSEGHTFISPNIATKVIGALRTAARRKALNVARKLNVREEQIVKLLLKGKTNREIAAALGLQEKTVKHYMTLLMHKLDARNRLELAMTLQLPDNTGMESRWFN